MPDIMSQQLPRQVADAHVQELVALDPILGTQLGVPESADVLPDFSPDGEEAYCGLARATLRRLAAAERLPGAVAEEERRCARLLRERLTAELAVRETGEPLRAVSNIRSPLHAVRGIFTLAPTDTEEDWAAIGRRMRRVPEVLEGYRASLAEGLHRGLPGGPRQVAAVVEQLDEWTAGGAGWFGEFAAQGPERLRRDLERSAAHATAALSELRGWLSGSYGPAVHGAPDVVGPERYACWSRKWNGTDLDLLEAYEYGWSEFHRLYAEMVTAAEKVLPGASDPWAALCHLDAHGEHVEGVEETRLWLQDLMDDTIAQLDGEHFDLADRIKRVESCIAPPGTAAAPYYTSPSEDFSRPGRTWLPTLGATRFPVYDLVSTWYHEGVPGHHLQLAQWVHVADRLSRYQATVGQVSANSEGWALYAERLMDELGFLGVPAHRLGYLDCQMMRAIRVIVDIGMHLELEIPAHSTFAPGERWTPELGRAFFGRYCSRSSEFADSELVRYLGMPGQAIGYKLGERAWLAGREAARAARGADFDLKAWHMEALSLGSLGLDDLVDELARLGAGRTSPHDNPQEEKAPWPWM